MFCFLYKWMISRARDLDKELSGPVSRHIRRCRVCREFDRFSQSLSGRFARDLPGFLQENNHFLEEKMIAGLVAKPVTELPRKRHLFPIPALPLAAVLVILVVSAGIIFKIIPAAPPGQIEKGEKTIEHIAEPTLARIPFQGIVGSMESSVAAEMRGLEKTVKSAAEHLASCLDFKITPRANEPQGNSKKLKKI
jgi:hypothetical protein